MNIYVVVEGEVTERKVYECWIPFVNPSLAPARSVEEVGTNNFYIVSGFGYPSYLNVIDNALCDVAEIPGFDRLVIAVDSEEMTYDEKHKEILGIVQQHDSHIEVRVIVQDFCLETWALGNRKVGYCNPKSDELKCYKRHHDVATTDPALLTVPDGMELTRAQFANKYLRLILREKYRRLIYSKTNPKPLLYRHYYDQVKRRLIETGHIASFNDFLTAFS